MDPDAEAEVVRFAESMLEGNDQSHDLGHALAVYRNAQAIADDEGLSRRDRRVVFAAALLHDVADHKYPDAEAKRASLAAFLESFFAGEADAAAEVLAIIDNVSFSKERSGKRRLHSLLLDVVADADRLEALGVEGIRRFRGGMDDAPAARHREVLEHCHEKLAELLPGGFIRTRKGRELAAPLHEEILAFMREREAADP